MGTTDHTGTTMKGSSCPGSRADSREVAPVKGNRVKQPNWGEGVWRLQHNVPLVQDNARMLEHGAIQHQAFIFTALPAHITLIQPAHEAAPN
ncbi:MAG: hypothetical protein FRX49_04122 [Trebouxia sp. A1-2]|nr:MAG: hypothetical protein FRX49_04122 [Trebouxia sp. A1-2]